MTLLHFAHWLIVHSWIRGYLVSHHLLITAGQVWLTSTSPAQFIVRLVKMIFGA